jgi:uncharacterized protein (TIGR02453 family)
MLHKSTVDFLKKLEKNNNRDWFNKNKQLFEDAKYDFEVFIFDLIQKTADFDESISGLEPKDCIFRIYKDVRFSKDKTPYKTNLGASINEGGRKMPTAGYYIHIGAKECFIAGGLYGPAPDKLLAVRNEIYNNLKGFKKIINHNDFKKYFKEIWGGNKLKTAPKGFDKKHPSAEYLKLKSFIVWHNVDEKRVLSKNYIDYAAKVFKAMKPFNDFLNKAAG